MPGTLLGHTNMSGKRRRKRKAVDPYPYKFRGLVLDPYQAEAILRLRQQCSTVVSAPTGTGKTLIADYLVEETLGAGKRLVYTGPIKALVSQKYRDFTKRIGLDKVGMLTGDVSVNPTAPILVMTTEIFRNMLVQQPERLADVAWVVFDEIHYLNHMERGTVWEEAIIFMPKGMRLLGLSATVPNARQIGEWIESVQQEPVAVIEHEERAVPLAHLFFNNVCQAVSRDEMVRAFISTVLPRRDDLDVKSGAVDLADIGDLPQVRGYREDTSHLDMISYVARHNLFPCLYFVFSRQGCEARAAELASRRDFLRTQEKEVVRIAVKRTLEELGLTPHQIPELDSMMHQWRRGIAVHHAGLLPAVKRIVEVLLERKVLRVVYATETFAVGVNMPVRCVCFDTLQKYDSLGYRVISYQEYFQMAGRAGRRGADRQGTVITRVEFHTLRKTGLPDWEQAELEPIQSRLFFTYNMVANLLGRMSDDQVRSLCARTLASYQTDRSAESGLTEEEESLFAEYRRKVAQLQELQYVDKGVLLPKGIHLRSIYVKELLVTELVYSRVLEELEPGEVAGLAAALVYSRHVREGFPLTPQRWVSELGLVSERLQRRLGDTQRDDLSFFVPVAGPIVRWADGQRMSEVLKGIPLQAGDIVTLCRQSIDLLQQMANAQPEDQAFKSKIKDSIARIDRDVVRVHL